MLRRWTDLLATSFAPLTWGTTYLVVTWFMPPGRPLLVGALRALPAGFLLLAIYRKLPEGRWWGRAAILGALNFGIFFALLFVSAYRLPGGVAATLGGAQPLLVVLLAWLVMGERSSQATVLAALAGALGVGMVVLGPAARLDPIGVAAGLGATACMAAGTVLTRHWGRPVALPLFTAWQLIAGGLLLAPLTLLIEGPLPMLTGRELLGLAYLTGIGTGLAYVLWFRGIERIGTAASFLPLLSPVMALILGIVALGQSLTAVQAVGIALVLGGVYAGQRSATAPVGALPAARSSVA